MTFDSPMRFSETGLVPRGKTKKPTGSGTRQTLLKFLREPQILEQYALDVDTPLLSGAFDDLLDLCRKTFAVRQDVLKHTGTHDLSQGSLSALNERLPDIGDTERCAVRVHYVPAED